MNELLHDARDALNALHCDPDFEDRIEKAAITLGFARSFAVVGLGKSGIAARKLVATLRAQGLPAWHLDPVTALHGDLGGVDQTTGIIALSHSGATDELAQLAYELDRGQFHVGIFASQDCPLAQLCWITIPYGAYADCDRATRLVPSVSFMLQCLVGDALALRLAERRCTVGPRETHPGGAIGRTIAADGQDGDTARVPPGR